MKRFFAYKQKYGIFNSFFILQKMKYKKKIQNRTYLIIKHFSERIEVCTYGHITKMEKRLWDKMCLLQDTDDPCQLTKDIEGFFLFVYLFPFFFSFLSIGRRQRSGRVCERNNK